MSKSKTLFLHILTAICLTLNGQAATLAIQDGNPYLLNGSPVIISGNANYSGTIDAFVAAGGPGGASPSRNYGKAGALVVSASGLSQGEFDSLIRFDMAPVKTQFDSLYGVGAWQVDAVSLSIRPQAPGNAIFNANAAGIVNVNCLTSDSWIQGTGTPMLDIADGITYDTTGTSSLASLLSAGSTLVGSFNYDGSINSFKTYGLSSLNEGLKSDITSGSLATFELAAAVPGVSMVFNSRDQSTAANHPILLITASAAPEPGRIALLGLGLAGLIFQRRRSR